MNKVFMLSLLSTLFFAGYVFGPELALMLLSAKLMFIGIFLSFIAGFIAERVVGYASTQSSRRSSRR